VHVDVFRFLFAVIGTIRGNANSFGGMAASTFELPAILRKANVYFVPEICILHFVYFVKIVYVKAANVGTNFSGAVVAPVMLNVPDDMPVGAWVTAIVPFIFKLRSVKIINKIHITKKLRLDGFI
jgi:hypothetical protein